MGFDLASISRHIFSPDRIAQTFRCAGTTEVETCAKKPARRQGKSQRNKGQAQVQETEGGRTLFETLKRMEPAKGIEPPTYGLRNRCSTD